MRKQQKIQAEEMINLLSQAHDEIKKAIGVGENKEALALIVQCQDAAIQLGNFIEQNEGEACATIRILEHYCELLYQIFEGVQQDQVTNINRALKNLRKILIQIENSIKNEIKVRKVLVFLPYKASMWDSLESVWKAAYEDPDCDAYVIPIPYYDKNPDGSFREMHYEGDLYPDYVPVTDYNSYNFEVQRPDMIFIHNPYDEWNNVTCVPEMYFSRNLCHYTDCLVYIPYFILEEINANNQKDIDGMKHFCFLPGTIYSHKVIVQSEDMRQIYINEYIKAAKLLGLSVNRKVLEEKILGLGSPKLDKVQNTQKEKLEIPDEWKRLIEKADGTWKKIIFYNTSINALLHHNEKMLEKVKSVLHTFEGQKDEVVLLWRPHPLIPDTIKSMRPQLWEMYNKIVDEYRQTGWGIYDDSADMDRAIVLSDAYYGDQSSVVQLYKKTGKPVMIQNPFVLPDS